MLQVSLDQPKNNGAVQPPTDSHTEVIADVNDSIRLQQPGLRRRQLPDTQFVRPRVGTIPLFSRLDRRLVTCVLNLKGCLGLNGRKEEGGCGVVCVGCMQIAFLVPSFPPSLPPSLPLPPSQ